MQFNLNEQQKEAVCLGLGPAMILAGPGSGKTTVILERLKYLIYEKSISPNSILVITFTKMAAMEMKNRAAKILKNSKDTPLFGTVHSFFYSVLNRSYEYRDFSVMTTRQKYRQLENIFKVIYPKKRVSNNLLRDILAEISAMKNSMDIKNRVSNIVLTDEELYVLYKTYNRANYEQKQMDYDDILLYAKMLLKNNPDFLNSIQKKIKYILVDEFQDINRVQYELIALLAGKEANLFVVGDDDQSIYRFRGAGEENFRQFESDFKPKQKVILNINYRCKKEIIKVSSNLISYNEKRFMKNLESAHKESGQVIFRKYISKDEERKGVIKEIRKVVDKGSVAILCRTNSQLSYLAELLKKEKINFAMREKRISFYNLPEISPIIGYMMFATGIDRSRKRLLTFVNKPMRYIDREELKDFDKKIDNANLNQTLECISKMKPEIAVVYILKVVGYEKFILDNIKDVERISEFKEHIEELKERAGLYSSLKEWMEYVKFEETMEESDFSKKTNKDNHLFLYTFHASKGLEFDHVFILHVNEKSVPYGKNLSNEELEEERRMFYVALTRGIESVHISCVENDTKKDTVSRFIKECKLTVSK